MSNEQVRKDIAGYLATNWSSTPIKYQNQKFNQPDGTWIRLSLAIGDSNQMSMGSSYNARTEMIISIAIFSKIDTGTSQPMQYADTLATLFRAKTIGTVLTRMPSTVLVGEIDDHYMINVLIPSWIDNVY